MFKVGDKVKFKVGDLRFLSSWKYTEEQTGKILDLSPDGVSAYVRIYLDWVPLVDRYIHTRHLILIDSIRKEYKII